MAKKKHSSRRSMNPIRKTIKMIGSGATAALAAGPVLMPLWNGWKASQGIVGGYSRSNNLVDEILWDGIGYDTVGRGINMAQLQNVAMRDVALVGGAIALRWAIKKV